MNFQGKFGHHRSISRPRLPYRVQMSAIWLCFTLFFCILYAKSPPYFYFGFVWPTDLESKPDAAILTAIISTNFEVDRTIHCRVIAFLLLIRYVTLTYDCLTLNSCHTWRIMWSTLPPSWKMLCLFTVELYELKRLSLDTTENVYAATVHAPKHVTMGTGSKTITFLESPPWLVYSLCISVPLWWR